MPLPLKFQTIFVLNQKCHKNCIIQVLVILYTKSEHVNDTVHEHSVHAFRKITDVKSSGKTVEMRKLVVLRRPQFYSNI